MAVPNVDSIAVVFRCGNHKNAHGAAQQHQTNARQHNANHNGQLSNARVIQRRNKALRDRLQKKVFQHKELNTKQLTAVDVGIVVTVVVFVVVVVVGTVVVVGMVVVVGIVVVDGVLQESLLIDGNISI